MNNAYHQRLTVIQNTLTDERTKAIEQVNKYKKKYTRIQDQSNRLDTIHDARLKQERERHELERQILQERLDSLMREYNRVSGELSSVNVERDTMENEVRKQAMEEPRQHRRVLDRAPIPRVD